MRRNGTSGRPDRHQTHGPKDFPPTRLLLSGPGRRGSILTLAAFVLVIFFALVAFAVDLGFISYNRLRCQSAADAAALSGAVALRQDRSNPSAATTAAVAIAEKNFPNAGRVLANADVLVGSWDGTRALFTTGGTSPNAVKVTVRRAAANSNRLTLLFAPLLGHSFADVSASAVATIPGGGPRFRLLLDDEMIDSDVKSIQTLAASRGVSSDAIISDSNADGFVDLPGGAKIEVPTGQTGDEGVFDISKTVGAFPFGPGTQYTATDFLCEGTSLRTKMGTQRLQDTKWASGRAPHPSLEGKKVLDPVPGTYPVSRSADIFALVDPNQIYVSPVFKSDVSMAETDPSKYGSPASNLQGERRGLLAYKIVSARSNPSGGSYLPLITIEVVSPRDVSVAGVGGGSGGTSDGLRVVQ